MGNCPTWYIFISKLYNIMEEEVKVVEAEVTESYAGDAEDVSVEEVESVEADAEEVSAEEVESTEEAVVEEAAE